ncbi:type 1 glutamine amidotransferase [Ferriphaselus sp. R-1]|uniref:type 1 glutamine amidotransferase n=1 Tax=Ferriphaselus sp. R-1 TaxID=1485544 RepID=UPI000555D6F0|nr:type 1 glutamine amidotransferase [Ferriphaselus sp. R-1]
MKPVAIFRHAPSEGPGLLADYLNERGIPWQLVRIDAGEAVPDAAAGFSGLAFMGGPMSVNDDLPWIAPVLALIRDAVAREIPVLGHCLGGQLMSKALGGVVTRNPVKEIGWGRVAVAESAAARDWFGEVRAFQAFHWHGETFSLPPGAELLLSSQHCAHQAYSLGKHLALQCHIEMTEAMIRDWCAVGADEIAAAPDSPAVQTVGQMQAEMADQLPQLHAVSQRLYGHWVSGLRD